MAKRIGLARTQALIEGLKRTLTMGGTAFTGINGMAYSVEKLTGANALSTTVPVSLLDTTGGTAAFTLADASTPGQIKHVVFAKDAGNAVLTLATHAGASNTYTFANVGESLTLMWGVDEDGTAIGWVEIARGSGAVAGAAAVAGLPAATFVS